MTFFPQISRQKLAIEKKVHFHVKKLSRLKKIEGKNNFIFIFSTTNMSKYNVNCHFHFQYLLPTLNRRRFRHHFQGHSKRETLEKIVGKNFRESRIFVISRAKTFVSFEFRICLGRNFREKGEKTRKSRNFLPLKYLFPYICICYSLDNVFCLKVVIKFKSQISGVLWYLVLFCNIIRYCGNILLLDLYVILMQLLQNCCILQ